MSWEQHQHPHHGHRHGSSQDPIWAEHQHQDAFPLAAVVLTFTCEASQTVSILFCMFSPPSTVTDDLTYAIYNTVSRPAMGYGFSSGVFKRKKNFFFLGKMPQIPSHAGSDLLGGVLEPLTCKAVQMGASAHSQRWEAGGVTENSGSSAKTSGADRPCKPLLGGRGIPN